MSDDDHADDAGRAVGALTRLARRLAVHLVVDVVAFAVAFVVSRDADERFDVDGVDAIFDAIPVLVVLAIVGVVLERSVMVLTRRPRSIPVWITGAALAFLLGWAGGAAQLSVVIAVLGMLLVVSTIRRAPET